MNNKLTRDDIMEAFRDDKENGEFELYHEFSDCDKEELMFAICPDSDNLERGLRLILELWYDDKLEDFLAKHE
jgi:hypothetical protein